MQRTALFDFLLLDGSFVTAKPAPNDVDLVAVLRAGHDFERDIPMSEYALVSRTMLRRKFSARNGLPEMVLRKAREPGTLQSIPRHASGRSGKSTWFQL